MKGAAPEGPIIAAQMRRPVLHVAPFLWSGAGGVITRLCEHQRRSGPVVLITTGTSGDLADWPAYRRRLARAGVAHHRIDVFHRDHATLWTSAAALAARIREHAPGVIHAHAGVPTLLAGMARAAAGSPARLVGQMYSWGPDRPAWMDRQDAAGFASADRVVCSARTYEARLQRLGVAARRMTYLPWGLPLDELPYRAPRATSDAPVLGFVGRIEPRKGQADLVDALAAVRRTWPGARLELVGPVADAAYARVLRTRIRQAGLGRAVTLHGLVRDPRPYVQRWDLFVSASSDEGQGLAVLEAMALGVPVVARTVAGLDDFLVDGRTGVAVRGRSAAAMARAIGKTLASPAAMRGVAGRARRLVERRYDWSRMLAAFDRLYWR